MHNLQGGFSAESILRPDPKFPKFLRVLGKGSGFPKGSYQKVIYQLDKNGNYQCQGVNGPKWNRTLNPAKLTPGEARVWSDALTVSEGIYDGTIPDPTEGAVMYHHGEIVPRSFQPLIGPKKGQLEATTPIGDLHPYRQR